MTSCLHRLANPARVFACAALLVAIATSALPEALLRYRY